MWLFSITFYRLVWAENNGGCVPNLPLKVLLLVKSGSPNSPGLKGPQISLKLYPWNICVLNLFFMIICFQT